MTYDEIIEQLEITKSKIKEIARNEYGGESWNDDLDALTEAADIVADYSKATAQASEINSSDSGSVETIQSEVAKAVDDFVTWQQSKIGRDINSSELIKRVTAAGAKRVEIKSPVFQKIGGTSIAYCTSKNVTYGGVEDD